MYRLNVTSAAALCAFALVACGGDGDRPAAEGRILEPLPEAPSLSAPREEVPGTDGALAVVVVRPRGAAPRGANPTITFSKPMIALGDTGAAVPATIEPGLAGRWKWLGSASVEFVPDVGLALGTSYRVTVPAGLRALDGTTLDEAFAWQFSTGVPAIESIDPAPGHRWLDEAPVFRVVFDQPVKDLEAHARLEVEGGGSVRLRIATEERLQARAREPWEPHETVQPKRVAYALVPEAKLPLDRAVTLVFDGDLQGVEGPLGIGGAVRHGYRTHGDLRVFTADGCVWQQESCPWGPLVLETSNLVVSESLRSRFAIEPAVEVEWDRAEARIPAEWEQRQNPYVVIHGKFRPGTRYSIRIAAGLEDVHGGKAPSFEATFATDDRESYMDPGARLALIESEGDGALPVQTVNRERLSVKLRRLSLSEMAVALRGWDPPKGRPHVSFEVPVGGARNTTRWTPVDVRRVFEKGSRTGLFSAVLDTPDQPEAIPPHVVGQVTDFAVHAKLGATDGVVWVTRLSSGESVADAALSVYDWDGAVRWRGRTGADGLADLPGLESILVDDEREEWRGRYAMIAAEKGDEVGVTSSRWNDGLGPWVFGLRQHWEGRTATSLGLLFAERGIYRPGEKVHLKGLVRYRTLGEIRTPPADVEVSLRVAGPKGDTVAERKVRTSEFGTFDAEIEIPKDVPLGTFEATADAVIAGQTVTVAGSFRVEEYRAPQFRVDVSASGAHVIAQEPMKGGVLARYLFGGAMAEARVGWSLVRRSEPYVPPGNDGFTFGARTWWWDDDRPVPTTEVVGSGEGSTGPMGDLAIDLGTSLAPGDRSYDYTLEAEVADVDRQRVAGRASFTVHPAEWYAGVRTVNTGFARVGQPLRLELVAVTPDGARATGAPIHLEVKRREWRSIRKKGVGGQWFTMTEPEETRVHACDVSSAPRAKVCAFEPEAPGFHVIEATVVDAKGRRQVTRDSVYVVGDGWVSWQRSDTDRIDLVPDKPAYEPGETAKILVKSPFPEVDALLTVEREGIFSRRKVRLEGSAGVLEVPIDESMIPNAFVGVLLSRGRVADGGQAAGDDPGRPSIRLGYTELRVEKKAKRLRVSVTPDRAEYRPREKVKVDLQVRDAAGGGVESELVVWAVDEGVLRLTGYEIPDPVDAVHPPRGLSVRLGEPLLHLVERRRYGEKGETAGGGGGDGSGAGLRSEFQTTAVFLPKVRADRSGKARVEFEVPDNLTTWRIMAMAVTRDDRFGTGRSEVQVTKPLLALPALPRLARVGDTFEAGVVVHTAEGGAPIRVRVIASAEGLDLLGDTAQDTQVEPGRPREVRFRFGAGAPGEAVLRFRIDGGGERDALEQRLRVELPVAMEAVAIHGDTAGRKEEALLPPGGILPGHGGLELTFASTILGGFDENMRQLVEYPYGCLEQQASRLVPFVALRELSARFGVPWAGPDSYRSFIGDDALATRGSTDPDAVIAGTILAIEKLQNHDGGYRYWSSSACSAHYASAYAVLSLARAKAVGHQVDAAALARGQAFLASDVAAGRCEGCGWGCNGADDATRTFALWGLARTGAPLPTYYPELHARREALPLYARAMLADAMFVGRGDRAQARRVLDELLVHAKESPAGVHFEEPARRSDAWSSDARTTAVVLQTLATVAPEHPFVPKLARWLGGIRGRDGRYRNTQEASFPLMALADVARYREKEVPAYEATATLGGARIASARFEGRSMRMDRTSLAVDRIGAGGKLEFQKEGPGTLYYGALLRYAPAELPTTALDRGITVQRWFEPYEGGGQIRHAVAGELVRVKLRIASAQERRFAVIAVPVPAGLEVVDTSLATTAALPAVASANGEGEEEGGFEDDEDAPVGPWAARFFSPFNHEERRDGQVVFFADLLPPGVHTTSFVARATTPGDFVLQPAHAEEMYAPEVFGRSDGGRMRVVAHPGVAER